MSDGTEELGETTEEAVEPGPEISATEEPEGTGSEEAGEGEGTAEEFEIIRESGESQPPKQQHFGIRKRINKLNARVDSARQETSTANAENSMLQEKNKILEIALEQARGQQSAPKQPNADDFDEGYNDPKFQVQQNQYNQSVIQQEVSRQVSESTKNFSQTNDNSAKARELERSQLKHYERAAEIGVKDYGEVEDKAIEILGNETVNHLISTFDDSQVLLYYLGKNPIEAERISNLINTNPILGIAEIGSLRSELKVKPKSKITPNPDKPLAGGSPSGANDTDAKAAKLLEKATASGSKADLDKYFEHQDKRRKEAEKARAG